MSEVLSVCLSFDCDGMSDWAASNSRDPAELSRGEFILVGLPRVLDLLAGHGIRATFFVPGHTALAYPDLVRRIRDDGHEIAHHGWVHENPGNCAADEERTAFERGLDALDRVAGVVPRGYRSPGAGFSVNTINVLLEYGMEYDSSLSGADFVPYYLRQGDGWTTDGPYVFGDPVDIVELPFSWVLDDYPHFELSVLSPGQSAPSAVREIWRGEFDYALAHEPQGVFGICMHPEVIGRGHRMTMLDDLIGYMKANPGVTFTTCVDYASAWKTANPLAAWSRNNPLRNGASAIEDIGEASGRAALEDRVDL